MKVTIINTDKLVGVNSEFYKVVDLNIDSSIHAIQWYETWGEIEYQSVIENNKLIKPANTFIDSFSEFEIVINQWQLAKKEEAKRIADEAEAKRIKEEAQRLEDEKIIQEFFAEQQLKTNNITSNA